MRLRDKAGSVVALHNIAFVNESGDNCSLVPTRSQFTVAYIGGPMATWEYEYEDTEPMLEDFNFIAAWIEKREIRENR